MHELGLSLGAKFKAGDLVLLTGPLGAGKTTLTRGIGEALGAIGNVSSPTFVIARTHKLDGKRPELGDTVFVHVDAYRLSSAAELDDLDIDFENSITVVEWGKGYTDGITDRWLEIEIERDHTGESEIRQVKVTEHNSTEANHV
jgi:tRNA threonylcarbamoyl adenosine modification protein YjeE